MNSSAIWFGLLLSCQWFLFIIFCGFACAVCNFIFIFIFIEKIPYACKSIACARKQSRWDAAFIMQSSVTINLARKGDLKKTTAKSISLECSIIFFSVFDFILDSVWLYFSWLSNDALVRILVRFIRSFELLMVFQCIRLIRSVPFLDRVCVSTMVLVVDVIVFPLSRVLIQSLMDATVRLRTSFSMAVDR